MNRVASPPPRGRGARAALPALALVALVALVTACGGGGGGSAPSSLPPPVASPTPVPPPASTLIPNPPRECETRGEYTLCVTVQDTRTRATTVEHMKARFFDVYPLLAERFNRAAPSTVDFVIGPSEHIASASGSLATYQTEWMLMNPEDYDVVVHEIMHIIQNYQSSPGWLTEGIADYARHHYGINNVAAGWSLAPPRPGESYTAGYGTAARFFIWVEARHGVGIVDILDGAIRAGSYDPSLWVSYTGKGVDALWYDYVTDPAIPPAAD